jgi:NADP-dependent 3-hydroxy acid dehydrogenase YdfG
VELGRQTTALVTGGASGIGRAIARALIGQGVSVVLTDRDAPALEAEAEILGGDGAAVLPLDLDVRDEAAWGRVADAAWPGAAAFRCSATRPGSSSWAGWRTSHRTCGG